MGGAERGGHAREGSRDRRRRGDGASATATRAGCRRAIVAASRGAATPGRATRRRRRWRAAGEAKDSSSLRIADCGLRMANYRLWILNVYFQLQTADVEMRQAASDTGL